MMKIFIFAFLIGMTIQSSAADPIVVDVRRNITLAEDDPVYKDFYINADASLGLKKNMVVTAVRKINIRDASGASAVGEILVPVGQLKIIAVYDRVAVAREYTLLSRDDLPMLEQIGIMTGDRIDTKGSFIDNSKPKPKRKVAEETSTPPGTAVAVAPPAAAPAPVESADQKAQNLLKAAETTPGPALAPAARTTAGETLEKTADSGDNTLHE
ncbi:MAG TPA: hypothetical protein VGE46_09845 [Bdellovibrio sp.]